MNITKDELEKLKSSKTIEEWNITCDAIKKAHGGQYPQDWFNKVMMSGMAAEVQKNWNCNCGHNH